MKKITLSPQLTTEIEAIYQAMQEGYEQVASQVGLTCADCPDNCCDSYFLHHTYSEWAYLWQGLGQLNSEELADITERAKAYIAQCAEPLAQGRLPQIMCPLLNEKGLCSLYQHRMLVCRMHGIPATVTRPDGQPMRFPGCFRCQEIVREKYSPENEAPAMNRTQLFRQLAALESHLLEERRHLYPKVKKTIAEMIVEGPPAVPLPHCER
ncbi:MAG: YkgJ family cysteine cluster protein [Candidatus Electrothrix aestuarii]|uniref:YkgJ family cysteine cluster protein n=1 Tax=Candidatus Electrothrix aestuarii TaxID=3062594 RepID=A0AAU8LX60_9BACT|nr:YkgJ family cysteine cluster protein [Candidatus Electrothrix aestuarii]